MLDNLECLLEDGDIKGHLRPDFEGYEQLLHLVVERDHQSCLLLTSREKPAELRPLEGRYPLIRSLRLTGLDVTACKHLLVEKEVVGEEREQESLIEIYGGNPLALKMVSETIVDLFGGEIGEFLAGGTVIFGSIAVGQTGSLAARVDDVASLTGTGANGQIGALTIQGSASPIDPESSAHVTRVTFAAVESVRTGLPVQL